MKDMHINNGRPSTINHFIGQPHLIPIVAVALEACWTAQHQFPSTLMSGPPGVGKTELARVIALETGANLHETLGQNIRTGPKMAGFLLKAKKGDVLFIDECHTLDQDAQIQLYNAVAEGSFSVAGGPFGSCPRFFRLPPVTMIAATTDVYRLNQPLRDRFELRLAFEFYSHEELCLLLKQRISRLKWETEQEIPYQIATLGRGTPREALRLLNACHRLAASRGENLIRASHVVEHCAMEGIDELGLGTDELRYLSAVKGRGGSARLHVIAKQMGMPARTVSEVVEPYLIRANFIDTSDGCRRLTERALTHLANHHAVADQTLDDR